MISNLRTPGKLFQTLQELAEIDFKSDSEFGQRFEARAPQSNLKLSNVRTLQISPMGQFLLREAQLISPRPNPVSKLPQQLARRMTRLGHPSSETNLALFNDAILITSFSEGGGRTWLPATAIQILLDGFGVAVPMDMQ